MKPIDLSKLIEGLLVVIFLAIATRKYPDLRSGAISVAKKSLKTTRPSPSFFFALTSQQFCTSSFVASWVFGRECVAHFGKNFGEIWKAMWSFQCAAFNQLTIEQWHPALWFHPQAVERGLGVILSGFHPLICLRNPPETEPSSSKTCGFHTQLLDDSYFTSAKPGVFPGRLE